MPRYVEGLGFDLEETMARRQTIDQWERSWQKYWANATTVVLLAPIIIRTAIALEVDFMGPMIVAAIISNSAGMLTLVGDPATFLVGSAIHLSFVQYLGWGSLCGLLALLVLVPLIRWLMKDTWKVRKALPSDLRARPLERPWFCLLSVMILVLMMALFLFGEQLPNPIAPPAVAGTILLVKGYFVAAELMPEHALAPTFAGWPSWTLPVFVGMMCGATLGGNATRQRSEVGPRTSRRGTRLLG